MTKREVRRTLEELFVRALPYRRRILAGAVLILLTNGLVLTIPWLMRGAIDALRRGTTSGEMAAYSAGMAALAVLQALVRTASRMALLGSSRKIVADIRSRFFHHLLRLDATFYDTHHTGDIMSRGINDLRLLRSFYGPGLMNLFNTAVIYVSTISLMLYVDPFLTVVSLAFLPVLLLLVNRLSRKVYRHSLEAQQKLSKISERVQEDLNGIQQIMIFAQQARQAASFARLADDFRGENLAIAKLRGWMLSVIGGVTGVGGLLLLYWGGIRVIDGEITLGEFVAFHAYLAILTWPTIALAWVINIMQRGIGAMERIEEVLEIEPAIPTPLDDETPSSLPSSITRKSIVLEDLNFSYPGADRPALQKIHATIPWGKITAVVGAVGSGKSTLLSLLVRTYEAGGDAILVGERPLTSLPIACWRSSVGYAPQEPLLFSRSIAENVAMRRPEAERSAVLAACRRADLVSEINRFDKGLETLVGERGLMLSGGQRQRVALARALFETPPWIILDDPLSSVDAVTESAILRALAELSGDSGIIIAGHRLSIMPMVDNILVLDRGFLVEEGTHEQLIAENGVYAELVRKSRMRERLDA